MRKEWGADSLKKQVTNVWRYPSSYDAIVVQDKVMAPALTTAAVAFIGATSSLLPGFDRFAFMHPELALGTMLVSCTLFFPLFATGIGSIFVKESLKRRERSNRMSFGKLLTVSRAFIFPQSTITPAIQEVRSEFRHGYIGELHFVGTEPDSWHEIQNRWDAAKQGASDLFELAKACDRNDQRLDGITTFAGISHVPYRSLESVGFTIVPDRKNRRLSRLGAMFEGASHDFHKEKVTYPNKVTVKNGPVSAAVITREMLLSKKSDLEKFVRK